MLLFQVYEVNFDLFHGLIESELSGDYLNMLNSSPVNTPTVEKILSNYYLYREESI